MARGCALIVAGVMSGTSADGINVGLVRILGRDFSRFELLGHAAYPFPGHVRRAVLAAMNALAASVADMARLNFLLGELYAEAVQATKDKLRVGAIDLVGCHGQTLYHQGEPARFLGRKLAVTWQTGEAAVITARLGVPVVSDFRPADMAAGGKGAPLAPFLDYLIYRDRRHGRIVQNIGGIANLTAIPRKASPHQVVAFDTGPGNMVMDAVMEKLFGRPYDHDGATAARGRVLERVLEAVLRGGFFRRRPPKTAGREEFGREFVAEFIRRCGRAPKQDVVATATALTAGAIGVALRRFVLPSAVAVHARYYDYIVSGGGARNPVLREMLRQAVEPLGLRLRLSDDFGLPGEAKEAVAFAALAYQTWHRLPSNVPSATGARRAAVLGKISFP